MVYFLSVHGGAELAIILGSTAAIGFVFFQQHYNAITYYLTFFDSSQIALFATSQNDRMTFASDFKMVIGEAQTPNQNQIL